MDLRSLAEVVCNEMGLGVVAVRMIWTSGCYTLQQQYFLRYDCCLNFPGHRIPLKNNSGDGSGICVSTGSKGNG